MEAGALYLAVTCIAGKQNNASRSGKHLEMMLRAGLDAYPGTVAFLTHHLDAAALEANVIRPLDNRQASGLLRLSYEPVFYCARLDRDNPFGRNLASRLHGAQSMVALEPQDVCLFNRCLDIRRSMAMSFYLQRIADLICFRSLGEDEDNTLLRALSREKMALEDLVMHVHCDNRFEPSLRIYTAVFDRYYRARRVIFSELAGSKGKEKPWPSV